MEDDINTIKNMLFSLLLAGLCLIGLIGIISSLFSQQLQPIISSLFS